MTAVTAGMALALLLGSANGHPVEARQGSGSPDAPASQPLTVTGPEAMFILSLRNARYADAHRLQGTLGLLAGAGGPVPASPSTAGQRLQGSPRWVLDAGFGVVRGNLPATTPEERAEGGPRELLLAPRLSVVAGVFEGVSPAPTVGGIGALDLVAEARWLPVPAPSTLEGGTLAWGVGARLGLIRESFTLPGVTLVGMYRGTGRLERRGPTESGELRTGPSSSDPLAPFVARGDMSVAPRVTSLRAVVGKDLLQVGVSAGVQQDWIRGDAETTTRFVWSDDPAALDGAPGTRERRGVPVDRTTWFVGVNRTWVVAQVTAELGWSPRPDPPGGPEWAPVREEALARSAFSGAVSFRITY
jgi:hypothetical protein